MEQAQRTLYCGMTRATVRLDIAAKEENPANEILFKEGARDKVPSDGSLQLGSVPNPSVDDDLVERCCESSLVVLLEQTQLNQRRYIRMDILVVALQLPGETMRIQSFYCGMTRAAVRPDIAATEANQGNEVLFTLGAS